MGDIEKPKTHLVSKAAPETWYIKFLRPVWRKPHANRGLTDHPVDDFGLVKRGNLVVENIYKYKVNAFSRFETSPNFAIVPIEMSIAASAAASPNPEDSLLRAFSKSKNYVYPDVMDEITSPDHGRRRSFSFFSFALGRLCSVGAEDSSSSMARRSKHAKERGSASASRSSPRWFLLGCGGSFSSRGRRSRQGSMEHLKKADTAEDSSCPEMVMERPVDAAKRCEPWTGDDPKVWSMDLTAYGEVVKRLVEDGCGSPPHPKASTLCDLFSEAEAEADDAPMIRVNSDEDEFVERFDAQNTAPWSLSVSSSREFWRTERKTIPERTDALIQHSGELAIGNISDSQRLLRAKVFGAEMFRKQCLLEKRREEETKKLLFSLDQALDQYNHERITESNSSESEEYNSKCESPNYELFNSPVFESFLESSTKAWETDPLRILDSKPPADSPGIRELHCVTVQPPKLIMDSLHPKRRSPSICEDRIHHPQGEEYMILNRARRQIDERKRLTYDNKSRSRGYKQQRSPQQNAAVRSSSVSPRPPIPSGNVVKESVAVVVESSHDPYADFRESMIDMIVDQNIQQTTDLEELLQCYLALNEPDYHRVIIEVFSDVWHELFQKKP